MRKMVINDFLNMCEEDLLAVWIQQKLDGSDDFKADDISSAIYAFKAYGRTGVAEILQSLGIQTEEQEVTMISNAKAREFLTKMKKNNDFTIFSCDFIKRSTGEVRHMVCRYGVTSRLAGGKKAFEDKDHDVKTVYDMQAAGYKCISQEGLIRLKIHGQKYIVEENKSLADSLVTD